MKRKILLLTAVLLLSIATSYGQNAESKWGVGFHFGVMEYSGDYDKQFYSFTQGYAVGLSVSRYLTPSFDIMGHFFYDRSHSNDSGTMGMPTWLNFEADMFNLNALIKYKFNNGYILKETAFLSPFILAGVGGNFSLTNGVGELGLMDNQKIITPNLYGGVGLNMRISPALSIAVQTAIEVPFTDNIDGVVGEAVLNPRIGNDIFMQNSASLIITPGEFKVKDADKDGVADKLDMCPNTPEGVAVDANGCPLDSDKDGIPDYLDKCPGTPAGVKVDTNGCPLDTDKDGIMDYLDDCPEVFGLAAFKGCPDSDGDGVPDMTDRCPNTPAGYKVDAYGCPLDTDNDGIPDNEDACPTVPGTREFNGCPLTASYITTEYNLLMSPIYFDFNKFELKKEAIDALEKLSKAMAKYTGFGVQLDGYCDFMGTEEYNLKLSEKRARAAQNYLNSQGVSENRIRLLYYGEANPAKDNSTEAGRALNRRVEYNLYEINK
jgi:OmpA-OmpF porin, OOP family